MTKWWPGLLVGAALLGGCAATPEDADVDSTSTEDELRSTEVVAAGTKLVTTANVNLREGASTSHDVLKLLADGTRVTVVSESGQNGWVHVETDDSLEGWIANQFVERPAAASTATCDPSRGAGVVGRYQMALHDAIAFAEGTEDESKDGYNVMFSHRLMSSCRNHPNQCIRYGRTCSTAAGRYQILYDTWRRVRGNLNLGSFEPENQERAAQYLIRNIRGVTVPSSRVMSASEFSNAMSKLSYEWASLPPGRYGQPKKSMSTMRSTYCSRAGGC